MVELQSWLLGFQGRAGSSLSQLMDQFNHLSNFPGTLTCSRWRLPEDKLNSSRTWQNFKRSLHGIVLHYANILCQSSLQYCVFGLSKRDRKSLFLNESSCGVIKGTKDSIRAAKWLMGLSPPLTPPDVYWAVHNAVLLTLAFDFSCETLQEPFYERPCGRFVLLCVGGAICLICFLSSKRPVWKFLPVLTCLSDLHAKDGFFFCGGGGTVGGWWCIWTGIKWNYGKVGNSFTSAEQKQ